jgi:hypothetical protein
MTQGLLKTVFHDPGSGGRRRDVEYFRAQLRNSVFTQVATICGTPLKAACLPLFAKDMRQVVRFELLGRRDQALCQEAQLRLQGASGWWKLDNGHADVLLPEVTSSHKRSFEVVGAAGGTLCQGELTVRPQRKWSVWLVHHSHLDVGYTDRQDIVTDNQLQYLDSVLDLVETTASWERDARFRWNIEVNWPLERWFKSRDSSQRDRMVDAIRTGHVGVGALSLNLHTEACSIDELFEMVRFAVELRKRHGLLVPAAMQTDVPGAVTALVEVLADAEVRYLSLAHNYAGRSVPYLIGGERLERPFYWQAPSGKRVLVWYTDTLHGNAYMEGNIAGASEPYPVALSVLPCYLAALAGNPYPFTSGIWLPEADKVVRSPYPHDILHLRVQGKYGDNAPPNLAVAALARDWNSAWAYPHLQVARNEDFFEAALDRLGDSIPTWQGDWADWWADGLGSGARPLRWVREAQEQLRTGTLLAALGDLVTGSAPAALDTRSTYLETGLFDEHTWGARHPWEDDEEGWGSGQVQWQRKVSFARNAREEACSLVSKAAHRVAAKVGHRGGPAVVVLNACGWTRTDVVRVFLPFSVVPEGAAAIVQDERDGACLATVEEPQRHTEHRPAGRFLTFLAKDVPPLGYTRFRFVAGSPAPPEARPGCQTIETGHYRVSVSPERAAVSSITDLASGSELVNRDALFGFNSYVFDRYGTSTRVDHLSGRIFSRALDLVAGRQVGEAGVVIRNDSSDVGESVTLDIRAPGCSRLLSMVRLWRSVPRIEINNRLWKHPTLEKESVFFAFPFAMAEPEVAYELPGVATAASAPQVPGSPRHMRALRHWVSLASGTRAIAWATLDAPLVQFGDIHSPYAPYPGTLPLEEPEPATLYSWVLNNIWDTNFPTIQGGEMRFAYAITSQDGADSAQALAARLGESVSSPLFPVLVPTGGREPPKETSGSFCSIEHPEVRLQKATGSASGQDLVLWLNNLGPGPVTTEVAFPDLEVSAASLATVFEEHPVELPLVAGAVRVKLLAGETKALTLRVAGGQPSLG